MGIFFEMAAVFSRSITRFQPTFYSQRKTWHIQMSILLSADFLPGMDRRLSRPSYVVVSG